MKTTAVSFAAAIAAVLGLSPLIAAQQPDPVAGLKQSLAEGTKKLAQYEWVETTVISMKGEEKSKKQNRCYYGADGKVQKVPLDAAPPPADDSGGSGGRRGKKGGGVKAKVIENKKDEIQEYMKQAGALIQSYVPPNPVQIQAAKDAGHVAVNKQAAGSVRVEMKEYLKPGDLLAIEIDPAANRLLGLSVNSYLEKAEDVVTLAVRMATLPDGALYAGQTTLDVKAKNITVVITNSGHRPVTK